MTVLGARLMLPTPRGATERESERETAREEEGYCRRRDGSGSGNAAEQR